METVTVKTKPERMSIPLIKALILFFLIVCLEGIGTGSLYFLRKLLNIDALLFTALLRLTGAAIIFILIYRWGYNIDSLGLSLNNMKRGIKHGIFWSLGFGVIISLFSIGLIIFGFNPISLFHSQASHSLSYIISFSLIGCVLGPMIEDIVFIGLLYNSLRTRLNLVFSVLIVAGIFALCHGVISPFLIIPFTGGVLFCLSFEGSESLLTPMTIHLCGNIAIMIIQWI